MRVDQSDAMFAPVIQLRRPARLEVIRAARQMLFAAGILAGLQPLVAAQEYRSHAVDEKARTNRVYAQRCLKDPATYAAEKAKFDEFFAKYYFPAMTGTTPESLGDLGKLRYELFKLYLWNTTNEELQRNLTTLTYNAMRPIVIGPYHPAVRYNAVLTLGMLDEQYAIDGAGARPPRPHSPANKLLVQIVEAGAAGKAVPPSLVLGALVGLERHARFHAGLPTDAANATIAAALKIVGQDKPSLEMDSEVFSWIRLSAARVLAEFGSVGTNNQAHDALVKLIGSGGSIDDRAAAAALLAKINYEGAQIDGAAAAEQLLKLARDMAEAEDKRAKEFEDARFQGSGVGAARRGPVGRGGGFRGEMMDGGFAGEQKDEYPRSLVLNRLTDLRTGLTALRPTMPAEIQAKFDTVLTAIGPVIEATSSKDSVGLEIARAARAMAASINTVTATPAAATASTAAADARAPETAR
jgi:hypothetical protein